MTNQNNKEFSKTTRSQDKKNRNAALNDIKNRRKNGGANWNGYG